LQHSHVPEQMKLLFQLRKSRARLEIFTAMKIHVVLWIVTPCATWFHPEDGDSMVIRNGGIVPRQYTVSQPGTPDIKLQLPVPRLKPTVNKITKLHVSIHSDWAFQDFTHG